MGTRADFYDSQMTWLGSIAMDGYPDGLPPKILEATTDDTLRTAVTTFLARRDATTPDQGWPWPWDDSRTTDFAYTLIDGALHGSNFGHPWFKVDPLAENFGQPETDAPKMAGVFPDMSAVKNVTMGPRSGVILIGPDGPVQ